MVYKLPDILESLAYNILIRDSVGSIGAGIPPVPFGAVNTTIKCFRHALSLDERRDRFKGNVWESYISSQRPADGGRLEPTGSKRRELDLSTAHSQKEKPTDIKEVWFAGCHSGSFLAARLTHNQGLIAAVWHKDVGGGAVPHSTAHTLARISLRWMIRECFRAQTGIMFVAGALKELGMDPASLYPKVLPRPPPLPVEELAVGRVPHSEKFHRGESKAVHMSSEEEEELYDALASIYDQLVLEPLWWLLEILPRRRQRWVKNQGFVRKFECVDSLD